MTTNSTMCVYCLTAPAMTRDHVVPRLYESKSPKRRGGPDPGETVAACARCNSILGSKMFPTFEDRWLYVRSQLGQQVNERLCETCGDPFPARRAWARFCSPKCSQKAHRKRLAEELRELRASRYQPQGAAVR